MSGMIHFLRNYEFLNLTKSVNETQIAVCKKPNKTWSEFGGKLWNISCYNGLSIAAVGADVTTYLAVSALRNIGLFCPLPPEPPVFPTPYDNVQFIDCAIRRALWDWDRSIRQELEEGIESNYSDRWNVFQIVGEWAIAYSLENADKSSYYKPTFLTISEPLENGASFVSVGKDFARLWKSDQRAILEALYHQSAPSLGYFAKKVYQDIRGLASKLHQGNQNYLMAFSEYVKKKDSIPARVAVAPAAPPLPQRNVEVEMALNVKFLRSAFADLASYKTILIRQDILNNSSGANDPKPLLAQLSILHGFRAAYIDKKHSPDFLPWNETSYSGKAFRSVGIDFSLLPRKDIEALREAIANPWRAHLMRPELKEKLEEIKEFAKVLVRNYDFLKTYDALRIDLLVE